MAWRMETDMKNAALITLPTPAGTPYRTPSRRSRKSRRAITPRDISPATPLPTDMMDKKNKRISGDLISDGNVGFLDPRRFTPTLHASLVSEILNLRRDQEEKLKLIDVLETSLQTAYEEKEGVQSTLSDTTKECRTLKRQLSLLEGGTTSAIGDLMRERDESVDANAETKKRLEAAQQKIRIQEEDSQRVHEMWSKEKDGWAEERRKFERQIHIAESRLKMVIEEVAQLQSAQANGGHAMERDAEETDITSPRTQSITSSIRFSTISGPGMGKAFTNLADELNFDDDDDQTDVDTRQSVLWSPVHRRNMSGGSISSKTYQRNYSIDSQARLGSFTGGRLQMIPSVLRKLEGNIEEDDETQPPPRRIEYVDAAVQGDADFQPPPNKFEYADAAVQGDQEILSPAKKVEYVDVAVQKNEEPKPPVKKIEYIDTAVQGEEVKPLKKIEYVHSGAQWAEKIQPSMNKSEYADAASQYTPPPSPRVVLPKFSTPDHHVRADGSYDTESSPRVEMEIEANQSRKRVHVNRLGPLDSLKLVTHSMESSASQTAEPTSPRVLRSPTERPAFVIKTKTMETTSIATQTDEPPARKKAAPLTIPSISIVPPSSAPPTPREHVLPQYVKDVGCQVSLLTTSCTISRSVAVQTDEIRVDTRLNKLPRHLHPSSITSRPTSSASFGDIEEQAVPEILPPRNPKRLTSGSNIIGAINEPTLSLHSLSIPSSPTSPPRQLCPGNKDNVSLFADKAPAPCNPRISTLFSTFDVISSDEGEESFGDGDLSDVEFRTALSAPNIKPGIVRQIQKAPASPGFTSPTSPKDTRPMLRESASVSRLPKGRESNDAFRPAEVRAVSSHKPIRMPSTGEASISRTNVIRRTAMIQSGISAHQGSSQSPIQSELQEPPFPIPTRASSRQGPVSASAPSESSRPPSRTPSGKHRHNSRSSIYRSNSVRKARSAAAIPRIPRNRKDNYSSSPVSPSELTLASQDLPPLPLNDITRPPRSRDVGSASYRTHKSRQSTNTANTDISSPISASGSPGTVGVVDAIAQTMVGEWMFKYVRRRRKSFGVDGGARDETGNDRHKRWVWLAPYEQAILWSSKQPASGSALMGKSGRKREFLSYQS
ncbi:hypothetical protein GGS21DRAFT_214690 [Xylaria nigripes]|nr:hypothetical protein GGS21DRAFT_214690 [Xylaria nigripes]